MDTIQYEHGEALVLTPKFCHEAPFPTTGHSPLFTTVNHHHPLITVFGPILGGFASGVIMLRFFPDEPQWQQPL